MNIRKSMNPIMSKTLLFIQQQGGNKIPTYCKYRGIYGITGISDLKVSSEYQKI